MGVRSWTRRRALAAGLVTAGLVLGAAPPLGAQEGSGGLTVTTTDLPAGVSWTDIDNHGRLIGISGDTDRRIVIWRDGELTDVGPYDAPSRPDCPPIGWICTLPGPGVPAINDRGTIATSREGRAALWRHGEVTDVGGDLESSWVVDLNERDEALVAGAITDRYVLGLWSRGRFTRIIDEPRAAVGAWIPDLSDAGHVFVAALEPECRCARSFLWHRGRRTDIGSMGGLVNGRGQVAGSMLDPSAGTSYPVVWEDGEVTRLPTLGGDQTGVEGINDRGQLVGYSTLPGESESHTVLWDDGELVDIGAAIPGHDYPVGVNERGQVLIQGYLWNGSGRGYLWDDGDVVVLPPDDPSTSVEPRWFNDRGQVFGRRTLSLLDPSVATFWTVRRAG